MVSLIAKTERSRGANLEDLAVQIERAIDIESSGLARAKEEPKNENVAAARSALRPDIGLLQTFAPPAP